MAAGEKVRRVKAFKKASFGVIKSKTKIAPPPRLSSLGNKRIEYYVRTVWFLLQVFSFKEGNW